MHSHLSSQPNTSPNLPFYPPFPPISPGQVNPTPTMDILFQFSPKKITSIYRRCLYIASSHQGYLITQQSNRVAILCPFHCFTIIHISMDGERKKRKMEKDEEQEDDEEKSVEKFFALIRSTREARDRLLGHGDASKQQEKKQGEEEGKEKAMMGTWTPTFRLEDFMGGSQAKGAKDFPGIQAGPSERKEEEKEESKEGNGGGSGLDLNLSL